jgi:hypothetical protein
MTNYKYSRQMDGSGLLGFGDYTDIDKKEYNY